MMKNIFEIVFLLVVFLSLQSCLGEDGITFTPSDACDLDNVVKKNGRLIGLDILDVNQNDDFDENIDLANELEIEFIALHLPWSAIETSPNFYEDVNQTLFLINELAKDEKYDLSLTIRPIDIVGKTVPEDLSTLRFNDDLMISRFKSLLNYIFTIIDPDILLNLQIGNEIDGYDTSEEDIDFWLDYGEFLQEINDYLDVQFSGIDIGFTGTLDGLVANPERFNLLLENVDLLGVTYYPLEDDFEVKRPNVLDNDFDDLLDAYSDKDIYIQEIGYQTSSENNSSESKQADFFCEFFAYWDQHIDEIKSANIVRLNDLSIEAAKNSAGPYGIEDDSFIEYLRTLGIRTYEGEGDEKKAFDVIKDHLDERGW